MIHVKIIRKLSVRLIVFQVLAIHLFGIAFFRFNYFLNADFYTCILKSSGNTNHPCLGAFSTFKISDLFVRPIYCMLFGLLFGVILIAIFNWIKKKNVLNTLVVVTLFIILFLIGAFSNRYFDSWIYSLGILFSKKIGISNLIASLIVFSTALLLVWWSVRNKMLSKTETDHV